MSDLLERKDTMENSVNPKKLYIGNLPFSLSEEEVKSMCAEFGEIVEFTMITDRQTGRPKGFGFVEYAEKEMAEAAMKALDGKEVGGRNLFVKVAQPKKPRDDRGSFSGGGFGGGPRR